MINSIKRYYSLGRVPINQKNNIKDQNRNTHNNKKKREMKISSMNRVLHTGNRKDISIDNNSISKRLMSLNFIEVTEIADHLINNNNNNKNNRKLLKKQEYYLGIKAKMLNW